MNQGSYLLLARFARFALLCGAGLLASACVSTAPQFDANFGSSVRAAVARQTANPGAARNPNPVHGLDGVAARNAQTKYEASFAAPAHADPSLMDGRK